MCGCVYVHACVCVCALCTHTIHACETAWTRAFVPARTHTYTHTHTRMHTHTHTHAHTRTHARMHAHTYTQSERKRKTHSHTHSPSDRDSRLFYYGVATISRLLKIIGLFGRISSLLQGSFAKETCHFKEPTNRSHPICVICV